MTRRRAVLRQGLPEERKGARGEKREHNLGSAYYNSVMIRRLLFELLLFLLPFGLYALYLRLAKQEEGAPARSHPWTLLFASGLLLVAASFIVWGLTEGGGQQGVYVPPHLEDGRVVPGRIEPVP